jgi:hypothetical protein
MTCKIPLNPNIEPMGGQVFGGVKMEEEKGL